MDIFDVKRDLNLSFMEENEEEIEFGFNCVLCTEKFQNMQDAQKHFVGAHKVHGKNSQNQETSSMPNDQEVISLDNDHNSFKNSKKSTFKGERGSLPKESRDVLKDWVFQHISNPYPTEYEKNLLAEQAGLTILQVNNWFINTRRRDSNIPAENVKFKRKGSKIPAKSVKKQGEILLTSF